MGESNADDNASLHFNQMIHLILWMLMYISVSFQTI